MSRACLLLSFHSPLYLSSRSINKVLFKNKGILWMNWYWPKKSADILFTVSFFPFLFPHSPNTEQTPIFSFRFGITELSMQSHPVTTGMAKTQRQLMLPLSTGQLKGKTRKRQWSRSTSRSFGKVTSVTRAVWRSQLSAGDTLGQKYSCWHCC